MNHKDIYYIFIDDQSEKCVIKAIKDFDWHLELFVGIEPHELNLIYSNRFLVDDIMEELRDEYDYVEEIDENDIDDYMDN